MYDERMIICTYNNLSTVPISCAMIPILSIKLSVGVIVNFNGCLIAFFKI